MSWILKIVGLLKKLNWTKYLKLFKKFFKKYFKEIIILVIVSYLSFSLGRHKFPVCNYELVNTKEIDSLYDAINDYNDELKNLYEKDSIHQLQIEKNEKSKDKIYETVEDLRKTDNRRAAYDSLVRLNAASSRRHYR